MKITAQQAQLRLARSITTQNSINVNILKILTEVYEGKKVDFEKLTSLQSRVVELTKFTDQLLEELDQDEKS